MKFHDRLLMSFSPKPSRGAPAVIVGGGGLGNRSSVSAYLDGSTGKSWVARAPCAYTGYCGPVTCEDAIAGRPQSSPQTCCTPEAASINFNAFSSTPIW